MNIVLLVLGIVLLIVYAGWLILGRVRRDRLPKMWILVTDAVMILLCAGTMIAGIVLKKQFVPENTIYENNEYETEQINFFEDENWTAEETMENFQESETVAGETNFMHEEYDGFLDDDSQMESETQIVGETTSGVSEEISGMTETNYNDENQNMLGEIGNNEVTEGENSFPLEESETEKEETQQGAFFIMD